MKLSVTPETDVPPLTHRRFTLYLKSQRSDVWVKVGGWSIDPLNGVERVGDVYLVDSG